MRNILILALLLAGTAGARAEFEEVRELTLGTAGVSRLEIDAGAGNLVVTGLANENQVRVRATIQVRGNEEKARRRMEEKMNLSLERDGEVARLTARFEQEYWSIGKGPTIHLDIAMPASLGLAIDDGTGSILVRDVRGDVVVEDGTGSIKLEGVGGNVEIKDGTGEITVSDVGGDLVIEDGTGGIDVVGVGGSVTVDDGTGHIDVADVGRDLLIGESGTGGVAYRNVKGSIGGRF